MVPPYSIEIGEPRGGRIQIRHELLDRALTNVDAHEVARELRRGDTDLFLVAMGELLFQVGPAGHTIEAHAVRQ